MKKSKKIGIGLAVVILVGLLTYTIKPIYYRVYPFNRFTITYAVNYNGEEVRCAERYFSFEDDEHITVRNTGKRSFKIRGGNYGRYTIGLVVDPKTLYGVTDCDETFLSLDDFNFRFDYFNTNWWHITDIEIYIEFVKIDGEWHAEYKQVITEPDIDESGKTHTDVYEGKILLKDINNYNYLPLSDTND